MTSSVTDPEELRAILNPTRLQLYEALMTNGPATAAKLGAQVNLASGSLTYHLRQMVRQGLVEQVDSLSDDGREKWFGAVPGGIRWSLADFDESPASQAAARTAVGVLFTRHVQRLEAWLANRSRWSRRWRRAAHSTDTVLRLTPEQLTNLAEDLDSLLAKWREESGEVEGSQAVFLFAHAFPLEPPTSTPPEPENLGKNGRRRPGG